MTAHTQVCQYSIDLVNSMQPKKARKVSKIMWDKNQVAISRDVCFRIFILIKSIELSF
jgi:hypothetical protein